MMRFLLLASLLACGSESEVPNSPKAAASPAPAAAAIPTPAPAAAAAVVGPDGPEHLAVPKIDAVSTDAAAIAEGEKTYAARGCGGCHKFGEKLVGPDLKGVLTRRTVPWVERMVMHPDKMVKEDPAAKKLLGELMVPMPKQGVTDAELPNLIAYIKSQGG